MIRTLAVVALLAVAPAVVAQPERYELGRRLKLFEQAWEEQTNPAKRTAALKILPKATTQFFAFQLGEAGRTIDEARFALAKQSPTDAEKWLAGLCALPEKRLLDSSASEVKVTVKHFYPPKEKSPPAGVTATLRIGPGKVVPVALDKLPVAVAVTFPPGGGAGDSFLRLEAWFDGRPVCEHWVGVSTVPGLASALYPIQLTPLDVPGNTIEMTTLKDRAELLAELADGQSPESDLPANAMVIETTALRTSVIAGRFAAWDRPGNHRLTVSIGKKRVACRVSVPKADKPVPVVVALHGAGVTENMWFESYGAGQVVKECEKRGWLLVAPRSGISFGSGPPVTELLDELGKRYPIDKSRVFLVGHSMGAAQAVALAQAHPGKFRAAAALGGGGRLTDAKAVKDLPVFVGVGTADFALPGSRALVKSLNSAGALVTAKEYADVEHLVIVRESLPDAFAVFDLAARR